jgi:hypothetical protein
MAAVMFAMIPVVGVGWVGILYMLATLVLVGVRPPWSLLLFATLVATPAPVSFALGQPQWAAYFTVGMLVFAVPLAVGIRLIRVVRELQDEADVLRAAGERLLDRGDRSAAVAVPGHGAQLPVQRHQQGRRS